MKSTLKFLSALGAIGMASAHGIISNITIDGTLYDLYDPYSTPYKNPVPELIGWKVESNSPVTDVTSAGIACNVDTAAGALTAKAAAGAEVVFHWTVWPESHKGPTMTYLASCDGDCADVSDPTTLEWFKIDEAGLNTDGTWASDTLIAAGNTWTITLPETLKAGNYVMRHELLALHSAESIDGAQFYPGCMNIAIEGDGTAFPTETVSFPGAYSATDPGIEINIYYPVPTSYDIPGPAVWSGASSGSSSSSSAVAASSTVAAASSTLAVSSAAATTSAVATTSAAASSESSELAATSSVVAPVPTTFIGTGTGVFTGTGTGFPAATPVPEADPTATTGTDGVVTSTVAQVYTSTIAQTVVMTLTQTATVTATATVTVSTSASGSAGLQDATSSADSTSTLTMTETATVTDVSTITITAQASACMPAGRFRRDLW